MPGLCSRAPRSAQTGHNSQSPRNVVPQIWQARLALVFTALVGLPKQSVLTLTPRFDPWAAEPTRRSQRDCDGTEFLTYGPFWDYVAVRSVLCFRRQEKIEESSPCTRHLYLKRPDNAILQCN